MSGFDRLSLTFYDFLDSPEYSYKCDFASGVYLYELRSGSFKSAKKFVLMK